MITVDKSKLNINYRDAEYVEGLEKFAHFFTQSKPLADLLVDDDCLIFTYKEVDGVRTKQSTIKRIKVMECGEVLGHIAISERYRNRQSETVYEVSSFRIKKYRGNQNTVQSKDIKIALREAKKTLVSRVDDELKDLIGNTVAGHINAMYGSAKNQVRWDFNVEDEIVFMAMQAYTARKNNEPSFSLPATLPSTKNLPKHEAKCEMYQHWNHLKLALEAKQGHCVMVKADSSIVVYSLAQDSIKSYKHFNDLPPNIQDRFGMFKVFEDNEGYSHIGAKFDKGYFFVAP